MMKSKIVCKRHHPQIKKLNVHGMNAFLRQREKTETLNVNCYKTCQRL